METKQQKETLEYFDAFAKDWKEKAQGQKIAKVNVISQRNNYVIEVVKMRKKNLKTLDVGCGTGELVHEIAKLNVHAVGVDFAGEMIRLAQEIALKDNLANAEFVCASVFDFKMVDNSFDVISANGFLEYISYEQFDSFLTIALNALQKDGSLVLGSRNRLFNIFSLNEYTSNELSNHNVEKLLIEAILFTKLTDPSELLKVDAVPLKNRTSLMEIPVSMCLQGSSLHLHNWYKCSIKKGFQLRVCARYIYMEFHLHLPPNTKKCILIFLIY